MGNVEALTSGFSSTELVHMLQILKGREIKHVAMLVGSKSQGQNPDTAHCSTHTAIRPQVKTKVGTIRRIRIKSLVLPVTGGATPVNASKQAHSQHQPPSFLLRSSSGNHDTRKCSNSSEVVILLQGHDESRPSHPSCYSPNTSRSSRLVIACEAGPAKTERAPF